MAAESVEESAVGGGPEFDVVVETCAGDELAVGREGHMVDLFLVAEEAVDGLQGGLGRPEVDCAVVAGGDEALAGSLGGEFVAGEGFEAFGFGRGGDVGAAAVVEVAGAEHEVGGEREVVHPVGVVAKGVQESAFLGGPDFDGAVVGGGVDPAGAAPFDA